jgi:hypothetical protein
MSGQLKVDIITDEAGTGAPDFTNGIKINGVAQTAAYSPVVDVQTFDTSGTWTKPSSGSMARIQVWGGGGGASRVSAGSSAGGGGGGYNEITVPLSTLGTTISVTIGAGGAGRTGSNGSGLGGGNSSFGSVCLAFAGAGAVSSTGGGGGGPLSAAVGASGGQPKIQTASDISLGDFFSARGAGGIFHGGGGGQGIGLAGGSLYGGGGGGGSTGNAGQSLYGGNGGGNGGNGVQPGGGGGNGAQNINGGNGADGRVIVTVW